MNAGVIFINLSLGFSAMHPNLRATSSLNLKTTGEATAVVTDLQNHPSLLLTVFCPGVGSYSQLHKWWLINR